MKVIRSLKTKSMHQSLIKREEILELLHHGVPPHVLQDNGIVTMTQLKNLAKDDAEIMALTQRNKEYRNCLKILKDTLRARNTVKSETIKERLSRIQDFLPNKVSKEDSIIINEVIELYKTKQLEEKSTSSGEYVQ